MEPTIPRRLEKNTNMATRSAVRWSGSGLVCCPPPVPDVAEECAVAGQVRGGVDGPAPRGAGSLGPGPPEFLVSRSLADREDKSVGDGPHHFPVPVVILGWLLGGGFDVGHGAPFLTGTASADRFRQGSPHIAVAAKSQ